MLRGKFGKIGNELRDGHVVMDAFQQAAFRDQIRAAERITYLASMGLLKHKKTRNPLAAESTPRSSCPSNPDVKAADPRTVQGGLDSAHMTPPTSRTGKTRPTSPEASPNRSMVNKVNGKSRDPPGSRQKAQTLRGCHSSSPETSFLLQASPRACPSHGDSHNTDVRGREHSTRPGSAGAIRPRLNQSPGHLRSSQPQLPAEKHEGHRHVGGRAPSQVGSVFVAGDGVYSGDGGIVQQPESSSPIIHHRRPASAEGFRASNAPHLGRESSSSGYSGLTREKRHHSPRQQTTSERVETDPCRYRRSGKRAIARAPWTARQQRHQQRKHMSRSLGDTKNRRASKSPCVTHKQAPDDANVSATGRRKSADAAGDTRFMPVSAVHKAYRGHRLAAVQAWDPSTAAAVRAVRAEKLLRRHAADVANRNPSEYTVPVRGGAPSGATPKTAAEIPLKGSRRGRPSSAPVRGGHGERGGYGWQCEGRGRFDGDGGDKIRDRDNARHLRDGPRELTRAVIQCRHTRRELDALGRGRLHRSDGCRKASSPEPVPDGGWHKRRPPLRPRGGSEAELEGNREAKGLLAHSFATCGVSAGRSSARSSTTGTCSATSRSSYATNSTSVGNAASRRSACDADADVVERRTRLLGELENLKERVQRAEGRLRSADYSLSRRRRPRTGTTSEHEAFDRERARRISRTTAASAASSSLNSPAGDGVPTAGESVVSPLVVTHSARAFLCEL